MKIKPEDLYRLQKVSPLLKLYDLFYLDDEMTFRVIGNLLAHYEETKDWNGIKQLVDIINKCLDKGETK